MALKMVDMKKTPEEVKGDYPATISGEQNLYPWGLCIRLGNDELDKLNLDTDCEVGDMLHLFCLASVTSVSKNSTESGENKCVELQIKFMSTESEDQENEMVRKRIKSPYA